MYAWPSPFNKTIPFIKRKRGKKIILLVSGNAFWYGFGKTVALEFPKNEWKCFQSPSTFSLASAEMGWGVEEVICIGLHTNKEESIKPFLAPKVRFLVLLKDGNSVRKLTDYFTINGFGESEFTILESLGYKNFNKRQVIANKNYLVNIRHPVCVAIETKGNGNVVPKNSGKPDFLFINDGQITKQFMRSITLSALSPSPHEHLWDLGAGSGSISIEWLLCDLTTTASAVEIDKKRIKNIKENCKTFGLKRLEIYQSDINKTLLKLKQPNAVFIGGGFNEKLFRKIWTMVSKNVRIVINSVTVDTQSTVTKLYLKFGGELNKFEFSQTKKVGSSSVWLNKYPVVQWKVVKN